MAQPKKRKRVEVPVVRRQAILDQLNNHGEQSVRQISEALRFEQRTVSTYMREMKGDKEVRVVREERVGRATTPYYVATVTKTRPAPVKVVAAPEVLSNVTKEIEPGRIRHLGTHRNRPLQDSGGQGRLGGGSGVGSTLGGGLMIIKL